MPNNTWDVCEVCGVEVTKTHDGMCAVCAFMAEQVKAGALKPAELKDCPTCGTPCRVVVDDIGCGLAQMHYEPVKAEGE